MATNETELAEEVRQFTGYTETSTISDADLQSLIDIARAEIQSYLNDSSFTFYRSNPDTHNADRALFWFTSIALKVRLGELGNIDLTVEGLESADPSEETYQFWLSRFERHMSSAATQFATNSGAASSQIERTDRSYEYTRPEL